MEPSFLEVGEITYLSELTPTPIAIQRRYYAIGVGVKFADASTCNKTRYDLCRTSCSINHLLI